MDNRRLTLFLTVLLILPLLNTVQADETAEPALEAKNLTAQFNISTESVTLTWQNTETNDFTILQQLKSTNYSLYRSDEPLNATNYEQAELVADQIQACYDDDSLTICKNRVHVVMYSTPPNTDGGYYYGVISTLINGTIIANFSIGNAALQQPVYEYGSSITSPYSLHAIYDVNQSSTLLNWIDVSQVDTSIGSTHTTSLWSHSVQANSSNWNSLNKTELASNLSSEINSYEIIHPANVSRVQYYTVLHTFGDQQDTRLLSSNTLTDGLIEDNVGSTIFGTLQAHFNAVNSSTSMNWSGAVIEDVDHSLHIWRSASVITSVPSNGVEQIALLPANTTQYNFSVPSGYSGESYYMITLSDKLGNHQTNLSNAPSSQINEYTLSENQNIVTDLSASHGLGVTVLTWTDLANHSEAQYQVWRSTNGQIDAPSDATLIAIVDAGVHHYNHTLVDEVSENAWYAVTVLGSFGTDDVIYAQTNITISLNSLSAPLVEDTKKPSPPSVLGATYLANGTTQLTWNGDGMEQGTQWMIYRNLYADLSEQAYWVKVAQIENTVASQITLYIDTAAGVGEVVTPVYAIGGVDVFGNTMDFEDWTQSESVDEDRKAPNVQMKLYDSQMNIETSRWFTGGEAATFSNLRSDTYTIKLLLDDDVVSVNYTTSTNAQKQTIAVDENTAEIIITLSNQTENFTVFYTITDITGNFVYFNSVFCTSCLIETTDEVQNENTEQSNDNLVGESDEDSSALVTGLVAACIALSLVIIALKMRGTKPIKSASGLPSKSEDDWISKYINEKND